MNKRMWIILISYVINITCVNAKSSSFNQKYHTEQKTWQAASDECGAYGLEFDETVLMNNAALLGTEFWIGMAIYRVTTPWIEILGCYAVPTDDKVKKSPSIVFCQKQCESFKFFGYSLSTEQCLCQHNISRPSNISNCIGTNNSQFVFVYKVFEGHLSDNDDGQCTTFSCDGTAKGLTSADCRNYFSTTSGKCDDGYDLDFTKSYQESKQLCIGRYQLLLTPETYCYNHVYEGIHHWTNVFKEDTTAKLTQEEAGDNKPLSCLSGFNSKQNGKIKFNTTSRVCNETLNFICRTETALFTTSRRSLVAIDIPEKVQGTTMNIGPVIGGIAGAITVLTVLFVIIFCKIRTCGFFKATNTDKRAVQFTTAVYEHSQNSALRTSVAPSSNESFGLAPITPKNTYAVVNKIKTNGLQTTEDTYTETSYGEYDRLNGVSKRQTDSKTNLYDSHAGIRNEIDPTYDSSDIGGRKLQLDNDVYDHTDTVSTNGSDYGYSSTNKSVRNENDVYDKAV